MRIHYFQHVPFEGLGHIKTWAESQSFDITSTRLFKGETPPDPHEYDWLVIMGGPMNIYQHNEYPWLVNEKEAIAQAIEQNKTVLGVCLGGQLIADVLGAKVTQNPVKEIGWFPLSKHPDAKDSKTAEFLPQETMAFHWHGDTFGIPNNSVPLAASKACPNQGFIYQERVVGLQFHLETTFEGIKLMVENMSKELVDAPFIQTKQEIITDKYVKNTNAIMEDLLNRLNSR